MRKIALDIGDVRIGIASSDIMGIIAGGYETYTRTKSINKDMQYLAGLIEQKECDTVVLGLPINMDGSYGPSVKKVREFGEKLKKFTAVEIVYQDERLSTVAAEKMLIEGGVRRDKRKKIVDKVAATIILQSYLDKINTRRN